MDRWVDAEADAATAIRLRPGDPEAWLARAKARGALKHWPEAATDYAKALALQPADTNPRLDPARDWLHFLQPAETNLRLATARAWAHARRWEPAIAEFSRHLATAEDDWPVLIERGHCRYQAGQHAEAIADYNKANEIADDKTESPEGDLGIGRGATYAELGHWKLAEDDFAEVQWQGTIPGFALALTRLALTRDPADHARSCRKQLESLLLDERLHAEQGSMKDPRDVERDRVDAQAAALLNVSPNKRFLLLRACLTFPAPGANPAELIRVAEQELGQQSPAGDKGDPGPFELLGAAFYRAGRLQEAQQKLERAVALDVNGGSIRARFFLAMTHQLMGRSDTAREWLGKATRQFEREEAKRAGETGRLGWVDREELGWLRGEAERLVRGGQPGR
jgi:tetratricopeptide (TPR) repeat protein